MGRTSRNDVNIAVNIDARQLRKVLNSLSHVQKSAPKAVAAALNKTAQGSKTDTVRILAEQYTAKQKDIRSVITVGRKARPGNLSASIRARYKGIELSKFRFKPRSITKRRPRTGVTVEVKRGQSRAIPHTFIALIRGRLQVAMRVRSRKRTPIRALYGPPATHMMDNTEMMTQIQGMAAKRLVKNLEHEVERIQKGFGK